ncbi:MAG TPA: type VI secretion system-associated FHA domain protein TagH [Cellvibrio sp.]|nr:type VI secretion system-associated FHA domain protein TagH [Cellvibrio sp.]
MALQVTLVKTPGGVSVSRTSHLFNEQGGTFGRADTNNWQLPDPDKFLSSCHCEIIWMSDGYYLVDRSTNGTFLNGSPEPIGRGVKSRLVNGDVFEIGDYHFSVSLQDQEPVGSPFDDDQPFFSNQPSNANIFDGPFDHRPVVESAPIFDQPLDPLDMWDKVQSPQRPNSYFEETPPIASSSIDDIFGIGPPPVPQDFAPVDVSQSIDQAMAWPEASRENLIPEDWEDDFSDLGAAPFDEPQLKPQAAPIKQFAEVAIPKPRGDRQPLAERLGAIELPVAVVPQPAVVAPPVLPVTSERVSSAPPPPVQPSVAQRPDYSLIEAMGLDPTRLTESDIAEITVMTGQLMREIVEGMMGVLRSRTSIKNEFRMNVTTIQPVENNPLKFSVSADDALENMFVKKSNAYKKPVDAFREGFQEIAEHQIAMIGGIRQGFERMMERFNPENLEKMFNKQGRAGMIPGMQKAKYWTNYSEYYSGFVDNMESSFQHLFGSDFVSAYEDQLRRLAAARKRDQQ